MSNDTVFGMTEAKIGEIADLIVRQTDENCPVATKTHAEFVRFIASPLTDEELAAIKADRVFMDFINKD